jgi:transposase-like protein
MDGYFPPKTRNRFDEAFKQQAVRTLIESKESVTAVAARLGIDRTNLQKWRKRYAPPAPLTPAADSESPVSASEFLSLKREFESIKETVTELRSVVKKSLAAKY